MINHTIIFGITLLIIDYFWLSNVMVNEYLELYKKNGLTLNMNTSAALIAYAFLIVVYPLFLKDKTGNDQLHTAAILGLIVYGVYGFTLAAILPHYDFNLALKETLWGGTLYVSSVVVTNKIIEYLRNHN